MIKVSTSKDNNINPMEFEKLTLDTHILIWYAEGVDLSDQQVKLIETALANNNLYISAISIWEIAMLYNKGKIVFSIALTEWINRLLSLDGLNLIDLSTSILIDSTNLPAYNHKDPADRLIIASTRNINSYLMTMDQKIIEYGNKGYLKIIIPGSHK